MGESPAFTGLLDQISLDQNQPRESKRRIMNFAKRFAWVLPLAGLAVFGLYSLSGRVLAGSHENGILEPAVTLANNTHGVVFGTAAINSDGSVANCFNCLKSSTLHLGTGTYQVAFQHINSNITANNGFSRWVQVDTLSTGSISGPTSCTTADRAGLQSAVFVDCANASGPVDTSFFLFVAR
jgi:hypothetical protein